MKLCNLRIRSSVPAHSTEDKDCKEQTPPIYYSALWRLGFADGKPNQLSAKANDREKVLAQRAVG